MKAILFLGTSLVGAQYIREAVESLGFRPIFLLKVNEYSGNPRKAIEACEHYEADVNSLEDIQRAINENNFIADVVAITSLLDETLVNACVIAKQYNIIGPDSALADLTDKTKTQKLIPEFSPPSFAFNAATLSRDDLLQFLKNSSHFNQVILKPGVSSGAVGAFIFNTESITSDQILEHIQSSNIDGAMTSQNWVLQPRIMGRLHSLEGYVKNNEVTFLGFSRRVRKALTESMNEFPVDREITLDLQEHCQRAIQTLVNRANYKNGYFHCEFIITKDSAYLIDGNMGRVAGAAIVPQIALIYGKNPVDIYKHVFDLGLFEGKNTTDFLYKKESNELTLSINYCLERSAIVRDITVPTDIHSRHIQVADKDKLVPAIGDSDSAWVGFLVGFRGCVLEEIKRISIHTSIGVVSPFFTLTEPSVSDGNLFSRTNNESVVPEVIPSKTFNVTQ